MKQSEEQLRNIFEASHDGILVESNETISYVNKSYLYLFGYDDAEELIGQHISCVISSEDVERVTEYGQRRLRGEQPPAKYEFKGKRKDGTSIDVEASVSTSKIVDNTYITTFIRDITERKRAEEALRESELRFRVMFEQANVGIVQASSEGRLLVVNPGFSKFLGYSENEMCGMMIRDITHREDYKREKELMCQMLEGKILGYSLEKRYFHKDGSVIWGNMTTSLVRCASGVPFYTLAIVEDITQRKRTEEALRRSHEKLEVRVQERTKDLEKANKALQAEIIERRQAEKERVQILHQLVTVQEDERRRIARDLHDQLGQQLTALRLKLEVLKKTCGGNEELYKQVGETQQLVRQLDSDVDFLAWQMRPTVLDDLGIVAALSQFVQQWSTHFSIRVEFNANRLGKIQLTPEAETHFYRIAQEALNNVSKHAQASNVNILLEPRGNSVVLIIEDDGIGFKPDKLIFKGKRRKGMGLIGMQERAALIGGTLEIESAKGKGTTIYVSLPVSTGGKEKENE